MGKVGLLLMVGGYLMGSIPTGLILARLLSTKDIRNEGSGNIGATNVYRILGIRLGLLTLAGDVLKGCFPVLLASRLLDNELWVAVVAFSTFLGHLYSVYIGFRGGKGVATALGVFLVITPMVIPLVLLTFALAVIKWRYVSLGSLSASALMPFFLLLSGYPPVYVSLSVLITCLIFYRHGDNIERLWKGTEKKITRFKGEKRGS